MRRFVHALLTASLLVGCTVASDPTSGDDGPSPDAENAAIRSEEHTSELQSLNHISYAVFCLKKKK